VTDFRLEKQEVELALGAAIIACPRITRHIITATQLSKPLTQRRAQLASAIDETRKLLDELLLRQVRLGWKDKDAA
jgi:hypothetical protein